MYKSIALFFLILTGNFSVFATTLKPVTLELLSTKATLILHGEVISNTVKQDPVSGHTATFTEFKVIELIKGNADNTHSIKQIGGTDSSTKIQYRVHGVPEFSIGRRYVVFLPEPSALGFSSPLGLHQGTFSVTTSNGETIVSNGSQHQGHSTMTNQRVTIPLATDANNTTVSNLQDFINTVRSYNTK